MAAWAEAVHPTDYPIDADAADVLVAETDEIVGVGWIEHSAGDYFESVVDGELVGLYVDPAVAREGIGARLYERLESRADDADLDSLGTWATRNTVPFYEKQGFERVTIHTHVFDEGVEGTVVEMRTDLE